MRHSRGTFHWDFFLVKFQVILYGLLISDLFQWICKKVDVGLLDVLPVIGCVLLCDVGVGKFVDDDVFADLLPVSVGLELQGETEFVGDAEGLDGDGVGEGVGVGVGIGSADGIRDV